MSLFFGGCSIGSSSFPLIVFLDLKPDDDCVGGKVSFSFGLGWCLDEEEDSFECLWNCFFTTTVSGAELSSSDSVPEALPICRLFKMIFEEFDFLTA